MRITGPAHAVFAATLVVLGVWGLVAGDFTGVWQPIPKTLPGREILAYACALVALLTGAGLVFRRTAALAARGLLALLLVWMLVEKGRFIAAAPLQAVSWESWGETAVLAAAAWSLYALLADDWDRRRLGFAVGATGLRLARGLFGLALIAFGAAHLAYVTDTAALVPAWLPAHAAWVYLTGAAYIAAGVATLTGVLGRPAAILATAQIGLFTLLVWVPVIAAGSRKPGDISEIVVSWALTAAAWVVAESWRGQKAA